MPSVFKVFETDNQFAFEYLNGDGEVLLTSPAFANKEEAETAIQAVSRIADEPANWQEQHS